MWGGKRVEGSEERADEKSAGRNTERGGLGSSIIGGKS